MLYNARLQYFPVCRYGLVFHHFKQVPLQRFSSLNIGKYHAKVIVYPNISTISTHNSLNIDQPFYLIPLELTSGSID